MSQAPKQSFVVLSFVFLSEIAYGWKQLIVKSDRVSTMAVVRSDTDQERKALGRRRKQTHASSSSTRNCKGKCVPTELAVRYSGHGFLHSICNGSWDFPLTASQPPFLIFFQPLLVFEALLHDVASSTGRTESSPREGAH